MQVGTKYNQFKKFYFLKKYNHIICEKDSSYKPTEDPSPDIKWIIPQLYDRTIHYLADYRHVEKKLK